MKEAEMWCSLKIPFYFRGEFLSLSFFFFNLFSAALGLRCCAWDFPSCGDWGLISRCSRWACHCGHPHHPHPVVQSGLQNMRALAVVAHGLCCYFWHMESSRLGMGLILPALADGLLINYQTTREVQEREFLSLGFQIHSAWKNKDIYHLKTDL